MVASVAGAVCGGAQSCCKRIPLLRYPHLLALMASLRRLVLQNICDTCNMTSVGLQSSRITPFASEGMISISFPFESCIRSFWEVTFFACFLGFMLTTRFQSPPFQKSISFRFMPSQKFFPYINSLFQFWGQFLQHPFCRYFIEIENIVHKTITHFQNTSDFMLDIIIQNFLALRLQLSKQTKHIQVSVNQLRN